MNIAHKTRAIALGAVAIALLAGCSSSPAEAPAATNGATPDTAQVMPETREVRAVEVLDPVTMVVTPVCESDSLYGEEFTVHIDNLDAPEDGDCGFDEASAAAVSAIGDSPWFLRYDGEETNIHIDDDGDHYGQLRKRTGSSYHEAMIAEGYGHRIEGNELESLTVAEDEAKAADAGLWATCPDFGA